jgi:hypothetical protein
MEFTLQWVSFVWKEQHILLGFDEMALDGESIS